MNLTAMGCVREDYLKGAANTTLPVIQPSSLKANSKAFRHSSITTTFVIMKVLVIVVALLASAVASHLHSANMQWQAKQQEEAQNYRPSDVPKLAQHEYYNMGDSDNQGIIPDGIKSNKLDLLLIQTCKAIWSRKWK